MCKSAAGYMAEVLLDFTNRTATPSNPGSHWSTPHPVLIASSLEVTVHSTACHMLISCILRGIHANHFTLLGLLRLPHACYSSSC